MSACGFGCCGERYICAISVSLFATIYTSSLSCLSDLFLTAITIVQMMTSKTIKNKAVKNFIHVVIAKQTFLLVKMRVRTSAVSIGFSCINACVERYTQHYNNYEYDACTLQYLTLSSGLSYTKVMVDSASVIAKSNLLQ